MHAKNVYLDIYGEGTDSFKDYLREIVRAENIEQYVTFHGFVTRETIKDAYKSHDILVFPSVWGEPFAAVPLEAMSCGLAIVATSAGGTPEAIIDGETGLVVSPNNPDELASALKHLIDDDDLRAQLGQSAARAAREHFDFRLYVNQLEAHYTERVTPGGSLRL
jgi:glycosyltransferase involved in cell wall biosynthesis